MPEEAPAAATLRKQEKLAVLGRLSAGLAHELNNPAAAGQRAAHQLRESMNTTRSRLLDCIQDLPAASRRILWQLQTAATCEPLDPLDPLTQSDREEALSDWLDEREVANAWKLAPPLVSSGLSPERLAELAEQLSPIAFSQAISWLSETLTLAGLISEIEFSTGRISQLVKAIKSYSYMDQTSLQEIDLRESLETTLTLLNHKLKYEITIVRDYAENLPKIPAHGGELSQVWTNILDNAAYALKHRPMPDRQPTIWIRTLRLEDAIQVEIQDNAAGIPEAVQPQIFEPFFTTKGMGEGSGLGLDIVRQIVVQRHHGEIHVSSQPGDTRFLIKLPLHPPVCPPVSQPDLSS